MGLLGNLFHKQVYYVNFKKEISPKNNEGYIHWHERAKRECLAYARKCLCVKPIREEAWLFVRESISSYIEAAKHAANLQEIDVVNGILLELSTHRNLYENIMVYDGFDDQETISWKDMFDEDLMGLENFTGYKYVYFLKNLDEHISRPSYEKTRCRPEKPVKDKMESAECFRFREIKYRRDVEEWNKLIRMSFPELPERDSCASDWEFHKKKCEYVDLFIVWSEAQKDKDMSQVDRLKGFIKPKVPIREKGELVDNFYLRIVQYKNDKFAYDMKTLKPRCPNQLPWEKDADFEKRKEFYNKNLVEYFKKGGMLIKPIKKPEELPSTFKKRQRVYESELAIYYRVQESMKPKETPKVCIELLYRDSLKKKGK